MRPKHTFLSVARQLAQGFEDGSIVLDESETADKPELDRIQSTMLTLLEMVEDLEKTIDSLPHPPKPSPRVCEALSRARSYLREAVLHSDD